MARAIRQLFSRQIRFSRSQFNKKPLSVLGTLAGAVTRQLTHRKPDAVIIQRSGRKGKTTTMTELELFKSQVPIICEIIEGTRRWSDAEYQQWRHDQLEAASAECRQYAEKIMLTIDEYRGRRAD